jgi:hypothetical protein
MITPTEQDRRNWLRMANSSGADLWPGNVASLKRVAVAEHVHEREYAHINEAYSVWSTQGWPVLVEVRSG